MHGVGKVLLEVNGLIDSAILRINLLLLCDELLLYRGGKQLVGILLRMNLEQRSRIDLAQQSVRGLLHGVGGEGVGFEVREFGGECL